MTIKTKTPKLNSLTDLYNFFKDKPKKFWNVDSLTDYSYDGDTKIMTHCAVGHLQNELGSSYKATKTLKKLGLTENELIERNDASKSNPKKNVLAFIKRKIKAEAKTQKTSKKNK